MLEIKTPIKLEDDKTFWVGDSPECKKRDRQNLASEILCAMIRVPENRNVDFDTLSDFAVRQADSLIKKLNEPEI